MVTFPGFLEPQCIVFKFIKPIWIYQRVVQIARFKYWESVICILNVTRCMPGSCASPTSTPCTSKIGADNARQWGNRMTTLLTDRRGPHPVHVSLVRLAMACEKDEREQMRL